MEQLIYEISGKKYLLFDYPFTDEQKGYAFMKTAKEFNGIIQGGSIEQGFFSGKVNIRVLIPEDKAVEFSNFPHNR